MVIRKFKNPVLEVYCNGELIGQLENQTELNWFRYDVVENGDWQNYTLIDRSGGKPHTIKIDKYGKLSDWSPYDNFDKGLTDLLQQQVDRYKQNKI